MKTILFAILGLVLFSMPVFAATDWGNTNATGAYDDVTDGYTGDTTVASPSGAGQILTGMHAYVRDAITGGTVRFGVFLASDRSFVAQSANLSISGMAAGWFAATTFYDRNSNVISPSITASTNYILSVSIAGGYTKLLGKTGSGGKQIAADYTSAGFPATLPSDANTWDALLIYATTSEAKAGHGMLTMGVGN